MTFRDDDGNTIEYKGEFALTRQALSLFNGTIKGDVSINFNVDNNSQNRKTLGYYGPQMVNQIAFTKQSFSRIRNGSILDKGYIVIQGSDEDSIECFYLGGNSNWIQMVQGLITELDLSHYTKLWTASVMQADVGNTSGLIFPLVDVWANGQRTSTSYSMVSPAEVPSASFTGLTNNIISSADIKMVEPKSLPDFYPQFYLHTLLTEIMEQNGLKISGNIINDTLYKSLTIGTHSALIKRIPTLYRITQLGGSQAFTAGVASKYITWSELSDPDNLFSGGSYIANKRTGIIFSMTRSFTINSTNFIEIYKNGVSAFKYIPDSAVSGNLYISPSIGCNIGDVFEIYITRSTSTNSTIPILYLYEAEVIWPRDYVDPINFLPKLKCIDVIKFLINYFSCVVYYDQYSQTLNINCIDKILTEDSLDWSDKYISHSNSYEKQANNNYIRWSQESQTSKINEYNRKNKTGFAGGNIETGKEVKEDRYLLNFPFQPSDTNRNTNGFWLSNAPLVKLTDQEELTYTTVTDSGELMNYRTILSALEGHSEVVRISDDGLLPGYAICRHITSTGGLYTDFQVYTQTLGHTTGKIYRQNIEFIEAVRIFSVKPSCNVSEFSSQSSLTLWNEKQISQSYQQSVPLENQTITQVIYASFVKPATGLHIDRWKNNLAIDNPNLGPSVFYTDPTIKELYYSRITNIINNPGITAKFLLSEVDFQSFNFQRFIYLKTNQLSGYFMVNSIENFRDGNTPITVTLYML